MIAAPGRLGVVDRAVEAAQDATVGELGKEALHRVIESQGTVLGQ